MIIQNLISRQKVFVKKTKVQKGGGEQQSE